MDLNSLVAEIPSVGPVYQKRLEKLGIKTAGGLLLHVPHRYLDFRTVLPISQTQVGEITTIRGELLAIKNQYTRLGKKFQIAQVKDASGEIMVIWFNQPFLVRNIFPGENLSFSGKIDWFGRQKVLISPEYEKITGEKPLLHTGRLVPVYPETSGVSSKWLRQKIKYLLDTLNPKSIDPAIPVIHFPANLEEAEQARKKLAFAELLNLEINNLKRKSAWQKNMPAYKLKVDQPIVNRFIGSLPFKLTLSQQKSVKEILTDLQKPFPMNRLLEGDVGSGKTVVATIGAFLSFLNGCQSVYMAPTQILAEQHFNTLNNLLQSFKVRISLVTSETKKIDLGRTDIFIGTHSLIRQKVDFKKVAFVVIDEQHRFGVEQRAELVRKTRGKNIAPHVLTMTATPIPRTVALTLYGDLDLSTLTELPRGRQKTMTWIVPPQKRGKAYEWIKDQLSLIRCQAFIICPLIEESEKETMKDVKAVTTEYLKLKNTFAKFKLGLLHGRLKTKEKNRVLNDFRKRKIDILVSTPVVEVGIDIPAATMMVIEAAERFGLAELHQLRGRVGRGEKKSFCLLFGETKSSKALARLTALQKTVSGFELAELDLKLRGPGEIFGLKQHGFLDLKIASWQDLGLIQKAKTAAEKMFLKNRRLKSKMGV
jgi:ATP-dependent DNA helicase RecG